ncbi:esterase, partial [Streptomyces sp. Wh19]|nr:esterase [Streptomyces sp. Wh19]
MQKRLVSTLALTAVAACGAPAADPDTAGAHADFDGDGKEDLVITDTSATVNGKYAAGYAAVVHGSTAGPDTRRHQVITQDSLG